MVGLVGVVQFGPQLILSRTSGKWADTGDPARQILLGEGAHAAISNTLVSVAASGKSLGNPVSIVT